jgi:hypothetical protein
MPAVVVYYDGEYFQYEGGKENIAEFMHFVNKMINPLVNITTEEEL